MKKQFFAAILFLLLSQLTKAQSYIPFQAVARDTLGVLLSNHAVSVRITLHQATSTGTTVYQETQSATTNTLGLITLNIGAGTVVSGTFASINWGGNTMFVQLEIDPSGGSSYTNLGTTQLQSVPYALYALKSGGGVTQPKGQIDYGTGSGSTSDAGLTRDSASGTTFIYANPSNLSRSEFILDSSKIYMVHQNLSHTYFNMLGAGNIPGFDTTTVIAAVIDQGNNILYGFGATADSVQILTSDGSNNYGLAGAKNFSSYLDVSYDGNSALNSLTVDSNGLHWQYNNQDAYSFPNYSDKGCLTNRGDGTTYWAPTYLNYDSGSNQVLVACRYNNYPPAGFAVVNSSGLSFFSNYNQTGISAVTLSGWGSQLKTDSTCFYIINQDAAGDQAYNITGNWNGGPVGAFGVYHVAVNADSSIAYGFVGTEDSTYILSSQFMYPGEYGMNGAHHYAAFMDVAYGGGTYLNSLTVDSTGLHWEYQGVDKYTFPNSDGSSGQAIITDGTGHLSFAAIPTATAWSSHQLQIGNGSSVDTITVVNNKNNIYNPASSISSLLVNLPSGPSDGDMFVLTFERAVTSITYQNGAVGNGALGSASTSQQKTYTYDTTSNTWY